MIVTPYKQPPEPPTVALLQADGRVVDERDRAYGPDEIPDGVRVWCSYDVARRLVKDGVGEALCWNGEEVRWRHRTLDPAGEWKPRPTDVAVIKLPFPEQAAPALDALVLWRDWLKRYRACPTGTTGSASMSLLRATLRGILFCSMGDEPPLLQTMGGRLEMGPAGAGSFTGRLEQWDMPAAYAAGLAACLYGGRWWKLPELPGGHPPDWWARGGRLVFVKARVRVPDGLGPLIRRPDKRTPMLRLHLEALTVPRYPTGQLTGFWTWQELQAAEEHGVRIERVLDGWVHLGGQPVFDQWWAAIEDGRTARGLAGALAKMTGNALWGRFCMDVRVAGDRSIRRKPKGRRSMTQEVIRRQGAGPKPAHDLAETVSGRIRARLFRAMVAAGPDLISAHTDGAWVRSNKNHSHFEEDGWRRKAEVRRLDVIDPQTLRYWPRRGLDPVYVMAGRTAEEAPAAFAHLWEQGGFNDDD